MIEDMRKKGKPVTPKLQEMADWLDSLEAGSAAGAQPGEVRQPRRLPYALQALAR